MPNQKVVQVKHEICDADHIYTMCNVKANSAAMKELSANTYKLYMYFDLNQDGYLFALSYKAVHEATGMSDKTYQRAIKELIDKGYLVKSKGQNNLYIFYDGKESENGKVKNTQRSRKEFRTSSKEMDESKGKMFGDRQPENTGEIIQDNTKDNTIYNSNGAALDVASLQFQSEANMSDDNIREIMRNAYNNYIKEGETDIKQKLVDEFSKVCWYKCQNIEALEIYADYLCS